MSIKVKIKNIIVHPGDFEIEAKITIKTLRELMTVEKKYYLSFNPRRDAWSPYEAVHKIASYMSVRTGKDRKVEGRLIRDKLLQITEEEFKKRIYYLWNCPKYEYRIGQRGIFKLYSIVRGKSLLEKDKKIRMALAQSFFQKQGGKASKGSFYWLGDYRTTKIEFDPEYGYEPAFKDEHLFADQYLYLGISLGKLGEESSNEKYLKRSIQYFELAVKSDKSNALAYMNWGATLLLLAQLRKSKRLYLESLNRSSLAMKYRKDLYQVYLNRGIALSKLAEINHNYHLYYKAIKNFKKTTEIKVDNSHTYFCWAVSLQRLAEINEDINLLKQSCKIYQMALKYNEKDFRSYMNLANALSALGEKTKKESYFKKAINNYKFAVKYNEQSPATYLNWGICLLKYSMFFNKKKLIDQSTKALFNGYLLAILQENWDYAIHIAISMLLDTSTKCKNENYFLLTFVFLEAIQVIQNKNNINIEIIDKLKKCKGNLEEADIVINAILDRKITKKISEKTPDNIVMKTALFLAKELTSKT